MDRRSRGAAWRRQYLLLAALLGLLTWILARTKGPSLKAMAASENIYNKPIKVKHDLQLQGCPKIGPKRLKRMFPKKDKRTIKELGCDFTLWRRLYDGPQTPRRQWQLSSGIATPVALLPPTKLALRLMRTSRLYKPRTGTPAEQPKLLSAGASAAAEGSVALAPFSGPNDGDVSAALVRYAAEAEGQAMRGALTATELSNSVFAIATHHDVVPQASRHLALLTDSLLGRVSDLSGSSTVAAFFSTAALIEEAPIMGMLIPPLVERLVRKASSMTAGECAMCLWAVTSMTLDFKELGLEMREVGKLLLKQFVNQTTEMTVEELALAYWATARIDAGDLLIPMAERLRWETERKLSELTPDTMYLVLWASADMIGTEAEGVKRLFPKLLDRLADLLAHMEPGQVAAVVWALGKLADRATAETKQRLKVILTECSWEVLGAIASMSLKEVSMTSWGFAALDFRNDDLLEAVADHTLSIYKQGQDQLAATHVPRVVWALAKLDFRHDGLMIKVSEHVIQEPVFRLIPSDAIHALLWSYRRLGPKTLSEDKLITFLWSKVNYLAKTKMDYVPQVRAHLDNSEINRFVSRVETAVCMGANGPDMRRLPPLPIARGGNPEHVPWVIDEEEDLEKLKLGEVTEEVKEPKTLPQVSQGSYQTVSTVGVFAR